MGDFTITVKITDRFYRLKIEKEQEELVRKAAAMVNDMTKEYASTYHYNDMHDLLAMVALQIATSRVLSDNLAAENTGKYLAQLRALDEILSDDGQLAEKVH
jgi:cell division protein ZapA